MASTDVMKALAANVSRLNLEDISTTRSLHETVQNHPTEIWRSNIWRACKDGSLLNFQSEMQELRPQDVSRFVNARDADGNTALIVASAVAHGRKSCKAIITTLLASGADIDTKNQEGRTALMEASLLGGLAAVEVLLNPEQGSPADTNLRDNIDLSAKDLAGTNAIVGAERRRRYRRGEHQGLLFDHERRRRIVELLDKIGDENTASTTAQLRCDSAHPDAKTNGQEGLVVQLQMELLQARIDTEDLLHTISEQNIRLRDQQTGAEVIKRECEKQANEPSKIIQGLSPAERQKTISDKRGNDERLQFRVTELKDGTLDTQIEMIRIFRYEPCYAYKTVVLKHSRPTIAYMDVGGGYLAKNGKLHDKGFINSLHWVAQAQELFCKLGSPLDPTWFQHTEPQLMALCVSRFRRRTIRQSTKLTLDQFVSERPVESHGRPEVIRIYVSRKPCNTCERLKSLVNKTTMGHGFEFQLIHAEFS